MKVFQGSVTSAKGFKAASCAAGIKYTDRQDMAMIYCDVPCVTAGTFTRNIVKAAPVVWDSNLVHSQTPARAVVINAGIANACTGKEGMDCCEQTARAASQALDISKDSVFVASTGVIGKQLPMDKIVAGVHQLSSQLSADEVAGIQAAKAIMTTDTVEKHIAVTITIGGKEVTVAGMCKGSGMIHPNMCTMLSFITTDAAITKELLQEALSEDVDETYNMVSVDGDTSTNDTVLLMASGLAENPLIESKNQDYLDFAGALHQVNQYLCRKIAGDGEGATALFEVQIVEAETKEQAVSLAKSVVTSSLTKAAIFGHDANWGRILCAMGYSGAIFDPEKVDLYFESEKGKIQIIKDGVAVDYSEDEATDILSAKEVSAIANIHMGHESATAWGCDLTYDYVKINADYRS